MNTKMLDSVFFFLANTATKSKISCWSCFLSFESKRYSILAFWGAFVKLADVQSRSQSPRYPCPAERETKTSTFPVPLDKGNEGSGNEIGRRWVI